ncbi:succinyl-diaminopimelate desuccinylase [Roseococcus sp. YIM B11640]|uniref:succinyl-diaminopimelate desuccinylase n=1 Tax=Roseococcus sp. YIM B11640 TaxID=3133973 RepID=UPI003C7A14E1
MARGNLPETPTDPIPLAQALIRCRSVTPADDGALAVMQAALEPLGFACTRLKYGEVENLFARRGTEGPHFCYAGHTDVVPPGDESAWADNPFAAVIKDGVLYGRGSCDMKGGIAAFVAGLSDFIAANPDHPGSISLLITGDEEGPSVDGTRRVLEWMAENGHVPDMCVVGEPTSKQALGDTIKVGRRGSMNAWITVKGRQGHSAYPHLADNPVHRLIRVLAALTAKPLDGGSKFFEASTLQVTGIQVDNNATNVIPAEARTFLNIRFNDHHHSSQLSDRIRAVLAEHAPDHELKISVSGESFLTQPGPFVEALQRAVRRGTGLEAKLDTGGGTSDARFITHYCPVAELGAVGATLHQRDEHAPVRELRDLAGLYRVVLEECLS